MQEFNSFHARVNVSLKIKPVTKLFCHNILCHSHSEKTQIRSSYRNPNYNKKLNLYKKSKRSKKNGTNLKRKKCDKKYQYRK